MLWVVQSILAVCQIDCVCLQVLEAVLERLQDFEDKVRSRAIATICEAAIAHPEVSLLHFAMLVGAPLANAARLVSGIPRIPSLDAAQIFTHYVEDLSDRPVVRRIEPGNFHSVVDPFTG